MPPRQLKNSHAYYSQKLGFANREICDEQVLQHYPSSVRRKVLRKLYMPSLCKTSLMKGIRQQFVDDFLTACHVDIFSPDEDIVQRGNVSSDLFLLVEGAVSFRPFDGNRLVPNGSKSEDGGGGNLNGSIGTSALGENDSMVAREMHAGEFINEVSFFCESPQIDTVRTLTVCKTLTISRAAYKMMAADHPGSAGKILHNLLAKVEGMASQVESPPAANLPKPLSVLQAGSIYDDDPSTHSAREVHLTVSAIQNQSALTAIRDLVEMHINKQKDDHTTRFIFAAARGDIPTITLMCDHGFDPDNADYDSRNALMVAAMKGNTEVIKKLLEYGADPNLADMHGSTALYEAAKNGHDAAVALLRKRGARLCMDECLAASTLCQAVYDGDTLTLTRLLKAGIDVNAADYDKRTAAHIAAAEGNVAAIKVLVEHGVDLNVKDRWNNTLMDEAKRNNAGQLVQYLESVPKQGS